MSRFANLLAHGARICFISFMLSLESSSPKYPYFTPFSVKAASALDVEVLLFCDVFTPSAHAFVGIASIIIDAMANKSKVFLFI